LNSLAGHCAKLAFKRYTYAQRGAKDRGEYRQATGAFAEAVMPCPLYPQKRTSFGVLAMSALCQKQTRAVQQNSPIRSARYRAAETIPEVSARLPWQSLD
jgi:hypothetical protein